MGKPKKGRKGQKDEDVDDDVNVDLEGLSLADAGEEEPSVQLPKQKKKKSKKVDLEEEEAEEEDEEDMGDIGVSNKKGKGMSAFAMLSMDDEGDMMDNSDDSAKEEEEAKAPEPAAQANKKSKKQKKDDKKQKKDEDEDLDAVLAELEAPKPATKKEKKKKKKKAAEEEEDIDAILNELDGNKPAEEEKKFDLEDFATMTQDQIAAAFGMDDDEDDKKKRKKKDKKKKEAAAAAEPKATEAKDGEEAEGEDDGEDEEDDGGTVKTAAQKKKEKKERQKQKKLQEKASGKKKEPTPPAKTEKEDAPASAAEVAAPASAPKEGAAPAVAPEEGAAPASNEGASAQTKEEGEGAGEDEEGESKSKKKRKERERKKKKAEEEKEEKKKKPSKMALVIQEQQRLVREEEEKRRQAVEDEERRIDEAIKAKEEKEQLLKDKKEKLRKKKEEKIARQKAEGTYLTPKQREAQRRAQQMLEAMKERGMEVPTTTEHKDEAPGKKKRVVYDTRKKKPKQAQRQGSTDNEAPTSPVAEDVPTSPMADEVTPVIEEISKEAEVTKQEVKKVVEQQVEEEEDVKDAWDAESEEEVEEEKKEEVEEKVEPNKPEPKQNGVSKEAPTKRQESVKSVEEEEDEEEEGSDEDESEDESSSEEDDSDDESSSEEEDDGMTVAERAREKALKRMQKRKDDAEKLLNTDNLRCPVVCVLGHVDTGKTKILDKLRRTNVQDGEAGGITQQIGATNVPKEAIEEKTKMCKDFAKQELKVPGLLIIDTPGHESFSNLRTRGSSLCDIAILVVDIMHGLEPQTIESINLLKKKKCPFIVALNKIDRLYQWQPNPHTDVVNTIKKQKNNTKQEFEERTKEITVQFAEQGLNVTLFNENKNPKEYISMVPTSAHSGDGMGNLVALICELTQSHLAKKLAFSEHLQATVMEVKAITGLGTTIDVILVNGRLREGQTIIVPGTEGPIITQIRGLLMPEPMKELRVKGAYIHKKEVIAAQGVKIIAKDLDNSLAGLPLHVAYQPDEVPIYKEEVEAALEDVLKSIRVQEKGVFVQASTLGSLEALLVFLKESKIPYSGINIGPVHRRDVMRVSAMLEREPQYAVILAFDVKVEREAQELADREGIRVFTAEIIYHLFDQFTKYREDYKKKKQEEFKHLAVFPCKMRVLPQYIFNSRDPIVVGVNVEDGFVKCGQPMCIPSKEFLFIGIVTSLEINHKHVDRANKGQEVCIKIEPTPGEAPKMFGRHFDETDVIMSRISRESIDAVKNYFRDEMNKNDWQLIMEMKKVFEIL